jgi:hypothetical protein
MMVFGNDYPDLVKALLAKGVNVDMKDDFGKTALDKSKS